MLIQEFITGLTPLVDEGWKVKVTHQDTYILLTAHNGSGEKMVLELIDKGTGVWPDYTVQAEFEGSNSGIGVCSHAGIYDPAVEQQKASEWTKDFVKDARQLRKDSKL
ncbi:hypothetical protein [Hymenobacter glacieicola]|uniref:Uncharacterized protein n=1 Tax=Hymenobacter glacieicola TaxID=1562124 RepID=A0ABQ1WJP7_9BACT|nr:hypothetical protein [Hymenobacter glacieicola]GGG33293.1 hypothetical protein GCM10011378_07170 [Hymenobacter glacieicola]